MSEENKIKYEGKIFPDNGNDDIITCLSLTQEFLIYGTMVRFKHNVIRF